MLFEINIKVWNWKSEFRKMHRALNETKYAKQITIAVAHESADSTKHFYTKL